MTIINTQKKEIEIMLSCEAVDELKDSKQDWINDTSGYGTDIAVEMIEAQTDYRDLCKMADEAKIWKKHGNVDSAISWAKAWEDAGYAGKTILRKLADYPEPLRWHLIHGFYTAITEIFNKFEAEEL